MPYPKIGERGRPSQSPIWTEYSYPPTRMKLYSQSTPCGQSVMDFLKLLPILFVAAQGEARAIHQQLLPAIPGYVPVYIQQGPDVEVIYESGRKVAVHESEQPAKPVEEVSAQKVEEEVKHSVQEEVAKEVANPAHDEPRPMEPAKVAQDDKSTHEDHSNILEEMKKFGAGSAVLVPGYEAQSAAAK